MFMRPDIARVAIENIVLLLLCRDVNHLRRFDFKLASGNQVRSRDENIAQ